MGTKAKFGKCLLPLIAVLTTAACSGGGESAGSSSSATGDSSAAGTSSAGSSSEVTVTFWNTFGQSIQTLVQREIAAFNEIYPNITINSTSTASDYDSLEDQVLKAIAAGTTPTMSICYPDHVANYLDASAGVIQNLDTYINDSELGFTVDEGSHVDEDGNTVYGVDDYIEAFWEEGTNYTIDGEAYEGTYSVPYAKSTEVLFYNKTAFEEKGWTVPSTWDDMWALCAEIKADPDYGDYIPLGYDSDSNFFITMCQQNDIPYTSASGSSHFLFNNDQAKAMVTELKSYYDQGLFFTKGTSSNNTYTSSKFTAGEVLMTISSTGGTTYQSTNNFEVGVAMPPAVDTNERAYVSQGPSVCFFSRASDAEKEAAWLFYKYISNTLNSAYYAMTTGYMPVRTSSVQSSVYQDYINSTGADQSLLTLAAGCQSEMTDYVFTSDVFAGSSTARDAVGSLLSGVLLGTTDVETAFANAMTTCLNAI